MSEHKVGNQLDGLLQELHDEVRNLWNRHDAFETRMDKLEADAEDMELPIHKDPGISRPAKVTRREAGEEWKAEAKRLCLHPERLGPITQAVLAQLAQERKLGKAEVLVGVRFLNERDRALKERDRYMDQRDEARKEVENYKAAFDELVESYRRLHGTTHLLDAMEKWARGEA